MSRSLLFFSVARRLIHDILITEFESENKSTKIVSEMFFLSDHLLWMRLGFLSQRKINFVEVSS